MDRTIDDKLKGYVRTNEVQGNLRVYLNGNEKVWYDESKREIICRSRTFSKDDQIPRSSRAS